jgi:hypothetical protein
VPLLSALLAHLIGSFVMRLGVLFASLLLVAAPSLSALAQTPASPPQPAAAQELPHAPLFCTVTVAHSCTGAACSKSETFGNLKLPLKLLIHFDSRVIASTSGEGFPHLSQIASFAKTGNDYVLQGVDHASGWMVHLDEGGAKMSFALTTNAVALIATGSCKQAG